jgi:hypothetical protein
VLLSDLSIPSTNEKAFVSKKEAFAHSTVLSCDRYLKKKVPRIYDHGDLSKLTLSNTKAFKSSNYCVGVKFNLLFRRYKSIAEN